MIVLSSTEGEVVAAFESLPLLRTAAALNKAFGYNDIPVLHQDNKSAIEMMHAGRGSSKHTKHFDLRLKHIQEMIKEHAVEVQHCHNLVELPTHLGTQEMPADHLSKAMTGRKFEKCMEALMGRPEKLYDGAAMAT